MQDVPRATHPLELLYPRSLKYLADYLQSLVRGRLWLQVLIGMLLGLATGILLGPSVGWVAPTTSAVIGDWLALPGKLFLALIQMIVIPLVVASVIRGLAATEDVEQLRRMGLRAVLFFVGTTALAIVVGLALASLARPGDFIDSRALQGAWEAAPPAAADTAAPAPPVAADTAAPAPLDLNSLPTKVITLLPANPLTSMVESNMLQVVIFSMVVGVALVMMPPLQSRPLLDLLGSLQAVCMTVVRWAMLLAPLAVFGLLAQLTARLGADALLGMTVYVGTVLLGLLTMFCVYLVIMFICSRRSPWYFIRSVREVLLLAFSTSSSAAVMPLSIKTAEEKLGVRPSVSQFIIPLGATINMNGTALYQGVAALFLAQIFGVEVSLAGMTLIVVTAVGASIGAPSTPGVGIVILAMVLSTVGIPAAGIALVLGVDRILDMSRTAINVCGDLVAAQLMDTWVGGKTSAGQQLRDEAQREQVRARTGADVLTGPGPGGA